jgi:hypothetical protein
MSPEARDHSFDELTRGLADGSITRGKALRLMGAAVVGGTLGSLLSGGVAGAAPKCKPAGKHCKSGTQCCSGNCSGGICSSCPAGQALCNNGNCSSTSCSQGHVFDPFTCSCIPQCIPACEPPCFCYDRGDGTGQVCGECFTGPCFTPLGGVGSCAECTGATPVCVRQQSGDLICVRPCPSV